jgi:hypothetical protein
MNQKGDFMKKDLSLLFAVGTLTALLVNPLFAGHKNAHDDKIIYLKSGAMIIPFHGEGGDEDVVSYGEFVQDEEGNPIFYPPSDIYPEGNPIGLRRMLLGVAQIIQIPALGIEDWLITEGVGAIDIDFYEGDPYLLKFWTSPNLDPQLLDPDDPHYMPPPAWGEPPLMTATYGIHRMTSDTMTEKYIVSSKVFSNGPLAGVVMTSVEHVVEPLVDPPPYQSTYTGFLYVPAHIDLEVVKKCAKEGKQIKTNDRKRK